MDPPGFVEDITLWTVSEVYFAAKGNPDSSRQPHGVRQASYWGTT